MDDDVKNLFQKFGQPTEAYREINREADSESAKKRWPLLRDVHLHGETAHAPHHEEHISVALASHHETGFKPASHGTVTGKAAIKTAPIPPAFNQANEKPSDHTPLRKMLGQHASLEKQEQEPEQFDEPLPTPAFLSKIATQHEGAESHQNIKAGGVFSPFGKNVADEAARRTAAQAGSGKEQTPAPARNTRQPATVSPAKPVAHHLPATHALPTKQPVDHETEQPARLFAGKTTSKDTSVSAVFGRLAAKDEPKTSETGVNSFFKKIFKP